MMAMTTKSSIKVKARFLNMAILPFKAHCELSAGYLDKSINALNATIIPIQIENG
jgi:hypothetical protein